MSTVFEVPAMAIIKELVQTASEACVFVFSGEGAHGTDTDISVLKLSPSWPAVQQALREVGQVDPEAFLQENLGEHTAPNSPLVTVSLNILHADLWQHWGLQPSVVLGHSVGEIAAACTAGILSISQAISIAHSLGTAMESFPGEMVHTELRRATLKEFPKSGLHLAAINYVIAKGDSEEGDLLSVTLCGTGSEEYLAFDPAAMKLRPCHPWHHPEAPVPSELPSGSAGRIPFVSAVSGVQLAELPKDHWQQWQRSPVKFAEALSLARNLSESNGVRATVLEMGAHPVMAAAIKATFSDGLSYACSMRRGERAAPFLRQQRAGLANFRRQLSQALEGFSFAGRELCHSTSFAAQGIASQQLVMLAEALRPFFPGLAPHDLYRFSSIEDLLDWGADEMSETFTPPKTAKAQELHFEILGCALRFPGGVETPGAFWSMLLQDDQDAAFATASKEGPQAAFLQPKFDSRTALMAEGLKGLGVEGAEAAAMDPQHGFALQLAAEMWHDAGGAKEEALAQPEHVGVYVGAWQPAISDPRASAYAVIGSSLSALAARVANAYNLQGPAVTVNTACSSALVAVHQAMQEARTGQLAYAVAGGVNLFGEDTQLFKNLRRAGMLSPTARCHTFSARADGYVRGEGGALFLLRSASGSGVSGLPSRAQLWGSAVTQNSTQKPLSSVDPLAQERVIRMACASASVTPASLAAVELHGTGTPLGDPVEVSALARVGCAAIMTASKMHVGHLESAAGAVGLVKAVLLCENSLVPSFNIHGGLNPQVLAAMEGSCLKKPGDEAELPAGALVGVSSFGFAGSNAHVVLSATPSARACPKYESKGAWERPIPSRQYEQSIVETLSTTSPRSQRSQEQAPFSSVVSNGNRLFSVAENAEADAEDAEDVDVSSLSFVGSAVLSIVGGDAEVDVDADLHDLGIDSLGLAELLGLLEDRFGQACISIDKIIDEPTCRAIVKNLEDGGFKAKVEISGTPLLPRKVQEPPRNVAPASVAASVSPLPANGFEVSAAMQEPKQSVSSEDLSNCWIRTTHVGSLPRPNDANLDVEEAIAQQEAVSVDIINDGEWVRDNYIADVIARIEGLNDDGKGAKHVGASCCAKHTMPIASDMKDVPLYAQRFTGGNGLITLNPKREATSGLACVGHPRYQPGEIPFLKPFLEAVSKKGKALGDCFFSVPSPGTLALFCKDCFFQCHAAYVAALGEALAQEYAEIAGRGLLLQVDCPDLAMGRHTRWSGLTDAEFLEVARCNIVALNRALEDVPTEQIRVHVCWGNYAGPHHRDMPAELLWPLIGEIKAKYILVEGANPRHRIDVAAFEDAVQKGYFKPHQVIVPGLVDTTTARVEDPKLIAESLLRYVRAVGHPSRVIASTDCGFASTAKSTAVSADIAWMKLRSLAEGAALATCRYIDQRAPVPCRSPNFMPTPFRPVIFADGSSNYVRELQAAFSCLTVHPASIFAEDGFDRLRWVVDAPLAFVALGSQGLQLAEATMGRLKADGTVSRRPATLTVAAEQEAPLTLAARARDLALQQTGFDKRCLVLPRVAAPPASADVVVVGAGLLGMLTAHRCRSAGFSVAVLEQRALVGGIWSMYANSTSQVNSSEGGYCIKELLGEEDGKAAWDNRDHSTAAEVLKDFAKLGDRLKEQIFTSVRVVKILGENGRYTVLFEDGFSQSAGVLQCRGVVLCINDRVGIPRPLSVPRADFAGVVADGTSDSLAGMDWRGKRVVIAGMGAFAVENVRTALEQGASEVVVVGRRHGTICPKAIDYLNFVKPWDDKYKHDTQTNVKQFLRWKQLYERSTCTVPECWPKQVKHDGHTISVSDIWFVAHFMQKLRTAVGEIQRLVKDGVILSSGEFIACDVVVGCIGFERSSFLCEKLTGRSEVRATNYLDKDMMYLADAEIDEGAFNSFFGSSVLEYGKFFSHVFVEGLRRPEDLGESLWGRDAPSVSISQRKWNQYIAAAMKLIEEDATIAGHARHQVEERRKHFWRTLPPASFLAVNRCEWEELHQQLNGGVPVPKEQQLPYFFEEIPDWC